MEGSTVVSGRLALSEIIALDLSIVCTEPFPIDFVEVVGLQHCATDDPDAGGCLNDIFDVTEHDVEIRVELWRVTGFCDREGNAIRSVCRIALRSEIGGRACEVDFDRFS